MRRIILFVLLVVFILLFGCQSREKNPLKQKMVAGILNVYNPDEPLKGTVKLEVKEVLRIDSLSINKDNPPGLHLFARDKDNNIYLCDRRTPRMYKFSADGKITGQFLNMGEGPGEFPRGVYTFQIINNHLWLTHSQKLVCFTREGDFVRERKFNRNITFIEIINEEKLIGNMYANDLSEERKRVCAVFDRNGEVIKSLFEDKEAGFTEIRMQNNGNTRILRFFSGLITNDILHTFDPEQNRLYLFLSSDYRIFRKDLQGKTDLVIHREHSKIGLIEKDKMNIISQVFSSWSSERRELLKDVFPQTFVAINLIGILPRGYIAVRRLLGVHDYVFDVFDSQGRFVYVLEPPSELPGFYRIDLSGKHIWVFKELEERDIFFLYEMTNLPV